MSDLHIDDFYKDTANILIALYKVFPRKHILYVEDICGEDTPDEYGLHSERFMSCFSTMIWLADEGYLRFEALIGNEAIEQAVISEQCFLLLSGRETNIKDGPAINHQHTTELLEVSHSRVNLLKAAIREKSSAKVQAAVETILTIRKQT